jgi:hypothetical protein
MSNQLDSFATEVDTWIEENCPKSMRTSMPVSEQVWASSEIKFPNADSKSGLMQWFLRDGVHQNGQLNMGAGVCLLKKQKFFEAA